MPAAVSEPSPFTSGITTPGAPVPIAFASSATANASDTGNGGSATDAAYQINVGLDVYVSSTGWGAGLWSA